MSVWSKRSDDAVLRPRASAGGIAVVTALLAGAAVMTGVGLRHARDARTGWPAEADLLYLPSSRVLRLMSLGHTELFADLVAVRANIYFGAQITAKAPAQHLARYFVTAAELDPNFHRLYLSGSSMVIYDGSPNTVDKLLAASDLLDRGRRAFPLDWELSFQYGFNKFFELPQAGRGDPRVATWRQEGVEAMREATLASDAPPWFPSMVARLMTKQGSQDLAIRHLEQAYAATSNEETREQIRFRLIHLHRDRSFTKMLEEKAQLEEKLQASYDYAPEAFSILAGPRRPAALPSTPPTSPTSPSP